MSHEISAPRTTHSRESWNNKIKPSHGERPSVEYILRHHLHISHLTHKWPTIKTLLFHSLNRQAHNWAISLGMSERLIFSFALLPPWKVCETAILTFRGRETVRQFVQSLGVISQSPLVIVIKVAIIRRLVHPREKLSHMYVLLGR